MKTIKECIDAKTDKKMSTIIKQAARNKLDRCDISSDVHLKLHAISKIFNDHGNNISYMNVDINLHKFFIDDNAKIEHNFTEVFAEYYDNGEPAIIECFEKLRDDFMENKSIFICLDLVGYGYDEEDDYATHSVSCILIPLNSKEYKLIYINSHGNDITKEFDIILAKTKRPRIKKIKYKTSIDVIFMEKFIKYLNKYLSNSDKKMDMTVHFTGTKIDTYYGANLQCGDNYGICYAFPYIIYLYFGYYYDTARNIEHLVVESSYNLLKKGKIIKFIHACIAEFNTKFKQKVIEIENSENKKHIDICEVIIQKESTRFVKDITIPLIKFITQKSLTELCMKQ